MKRSLEAAIRELLEAHDAPVLVALDGGSGAGKSTLAARISRDFGAALVQGDDFYAVTISDAQWDARTPAARAKDVIDWRRLRREALEPLLEGAPARWHPPDFGAGPRPDGTYAMQEAWVELQPSPLVVLDGAYSTQPSLADLIALSVLVDVPIDIRHARLSLREDASFLAKWHARWDPAEAHYFTHVRPPSSFDWVVSGPSLTEESAHGEG